MERGRGLLDEADDHPNLRQMAGDGTPVFQRRVKSAVTALQCHFGRRLFRNILSLSGPASQLFIRFVEENEE